MNRTKMIGSLANQRHTSTARAHKRAAQHRPSSPPCRLRLEQLEDRVTPSINPATPFELDGNVITTTTHDWDQVFANSSGALAASFVSDAVNTTADDIYTGGGSKDTQGIQQGQWLFTSSK